MTIISPSVGLKLLSEAQRKKLFDVEVPVFEDYLDLNLSTNSSVDSLSLKDCSETPHPETADLVFENDVPVIENLDIECQLGEGAQGDVFLVRHKHTNKKYAMKVCDKVHPRRRQAENEIKAEAKILSSLNHPFIVQLLDNFETKTMTGLLLEFCQGGDLFYHFKKVEESKRKRFSEDTVKFYVACIALALNYLHEEGYIFRDLKPENVLIDSEGFPKLCDFGLSISKSDMDFKKSSKLCGSKEYFPPEMVKRQAYSTEVDWW